MLCLAKEVRVILETGDSCGGALEGDDNFGSGGNFTVVVVALVAVGWLQWLW